ncbi:uncharacterized protein LOC117170036 [Belonocnema kinseyi]|uniref:uncharacterized protein LOC117170036 n=1 Tax=Belonocnema kinseyi TaxID=2817044 RepID=UPI00143D0BC9|nr:uncharacterized protein LOC117170036 [Belonocnema kinseyi]
MPHNISRFPISELTQRTELRPAGLSHKMKLVASPHFAASHPAKTACTGTPQQPVHVLVSCPVEEPVELGEMMIVSTLVLSLAIIINYIEFSSNFECLPNGEPIPGVLCSGTPDSPEHSPSSVRSRTRSPPGAKPPLTRLIVPPNRLPSSNSKRGYDLEHMKFLRLIHRNNKNRIFEFRKYTFPADTRLKFKVAVGIFEPLENQEQIVITTSAGDVFAILSGTYLLDGIYIYSNASFRRAKINIVTSQVTTLTPEEINDVPIGPHRPMLRFFRISRSNQV